MILWNLSAKNWEVLGFVSDMAVVAAAFKLSVKNAM